MLVGNVAPVQPPQVDHGDEVIPIVVGPEGAQRKFTIHKNLICAASEFFQAALSSNFVEASEQKVNLPEEDPQMFQLLYNWLYSGRVAKGVSSYLKKDDVCSGDMFWWKVYLMGDRLMIDSLRVLAVAMIQKIFTTKKALIPNKVFIEEVFESGKLPNLELYIVEHVVYWLERSVDPTVWHALPDAHVRFGKDVAKATIHTLKWKPTHPDTYTGVFQADNFLSPWKVAGVAKEPPGNTGGGTEVRTTHMSEYIICFWRTAEH